MDGAPCFMVFYNHVVGLQVGVVHVLVQLRQEPLFYMGGGYGNAFMALNASWVLTLFATSLLAVTLYLRRRRFAYIQLQQHHQ